ncbi:ABC transporter permease [Candidatus Litorirhabdus singularis]|nr:ABC transporter permease [Candidatus Litorirhabdus singularis]
MIELSRLLIAFVPVVLVIGIMWHWRLQPGKASWAMLRMLVQLLLIGYVLVFIFEAQSSLIVIAVILVMISASSWIALNTISEQRKSLYFITLISVGIGGSLTLALITQLVLELETWFEPRYLIPLAGMTFANAMTSVSLAAERLYAELKHGHSFIDSRNIAFQAGMIPVINSLFAVGLVSLPGMMTGQILSGVSPFIAARYQIMVMCMIFASAGLSTYGFLFLVQRKH